MVLRRTLSAVLITAAAAATLAACGPHSDPASSAAAPSTFAPRAVASAAHGLASSARGLATSGDVTTLENNLTKCLKEHGMSAHPVTNTIACAFPKGDTTVLKAYALQKFTPAVLTTRSARDAWVQAVVAKYLATQSSTPATLAPSVSS
jgi:hypothetical protein